MASQRNLGIDLLSQYADSKNVEAMYHAAVDAGFETESDWYKTARKEIKAEAKRLNIDWVQFAAIVAAMSPMKRWEENIRDASLFVQEWQTGNLTDSIDGTGGIKGNTRKGMRIFLDGNTDALKGPKVTSFFANLIGDETHVTVDSHAVYILCGSNTASSVKFSPGAYDTLASMYRNVARRLGITAHQLQAVTWEYRRWLLTNDRENAVFVNGRI